MEKLFIFSFAALILSACSNSGNKTTESQAPEQPQSNKIEITNDMENAMAGIPSWINEKTVVSLKEPAAHSGEYACVTNDTAEYSYAYQEQVKNIGSGIPKQAVISGWVYTTVANPKLGYIINVAENDKQIDWIVYPLDKDQTQVGKWVEFSASVYFKNNITPETQLRIFAWNQSKKPIYFDDLKITFLY